VSIREALIAALAGDLERSIANLGYPVGMGMAPHPDECRKAAEGIIDRITPKALALLAEQEGVPNQEGRERG
jgi:hypothetical protein